MSPHKNEVPATTLWIAFVAGVAVAALLWLQASGAASKADQRSWSTAAAIVAVSGESAFVDERVGKSAASGDGGTEGTRRVKGQGLTKNGSETANGDGPQPQRSSEPTNGGGPHLQRDPAMPTNADGSQPQRDPTPANGRSTAADALLPTTSKQPAVRVYLTEAGKTETVTLEDYVAGVVAAEMPLSFEPAALEAQAIAARTYIVRRLRLLPDDNVPLGADTTDTITHQAYRSKAEMAQLKKSDRIAWDKADSAARRTAGQVIVYGGEPIEALYFASGNGYTENSGDVFAGEQPYLRAVASPWDKDAPGGAGRSVELSLAAFYKAMGVKVSPVIRMLSGRPAIRVLERTAGKRVKRLGIGDKEQTGEDVRRLLGLSSADFTWTVKGDKIRFTARGSGHGVGMSQWGAQGMAQAGRTAREIVAYYYSGTDLMEASKLPDQA